MARKRKKLYECEILNDPFTEQQQKDYDKNFSKALATALYRSLKPEEIDCIIKQLKGA